MRNVILCMATVLFLLSKTCEAGMIFNLSSNASDLNNLTVGQNVQVNVYLSGLGDFGNPTELSNLNVDVMFSELLFGTPTLVSAGPIVPDPINTFTGVGNAGVAGAIFDNIFLTPPAVTLSSNGLFFSFQVVALATGSGTIIMDPPASGFDSNNDPITIDSTSSLSYRIVVNTVPEPSTLGPICLTLVMTLGYRRFAVR